MSLSPEQDTTRSPEAPFTGSDLKEPDETRDSNSRNASTERSSIITLSVGHKDFKTRRSTVEQSPVLKKLISDTWKASGSDKLPQNTYFIDSDPNVFEHLLAFLQEPTIFPLFYSASIGFDFNLYAKLEVMATFFGVTILANWIKGKKYLGAIKTTRSQPWIGPIGTMPALELTGNQREERQELVKKRRVYVCPRGIACHEGDSSRCGQDCRKARNYQAKEYRDEDYVEVTSVVTTVEFDKNVCRVGNEESDGVEL